MSRRGRTSRLGKYRVKLLDELREFSEAEKAVIRYDRIESLTVLYKHEMAKQSPKKKN